MELRAYDPERDFESFFRLFVEAGWAKDTERERESNALYTACGRVLVGDLGGEVESYASTHQGRMLHLDSELPLSVVSGVITGRVARQRGLALRLTAEAIAADAVERGAAVAMLGIFDQGFYDRLGFGTGPYDAYAAFDPAEISVKEKPTAPPVRLGADDWERVHAARMARRSVHGSIVVDDPRWTQQELLRREGAIGLGFEDPGSGEITHHLFAMPQGGHSGAWNVAWLVYRNPRQMRELMTLLASMADQLKLVRLIEPPGLQIQSLVNRPFRRRGLSEGGKFEATSRVFAWWQARILDLEACVAGTRLPGGESVTFGLVLSDPVTEYLMPATREKWSGVAGEWTVTLGPESRAERGVSNGLPLLRTSVGTFTRLWLGAARPTDLAFLATDLDAPPDLLAQLDRVLRLPFPRPDWDI
ncbi:MAG: GNAT family N-acetyltransferase [Planctomycetota bacterium]|jgi:hypothetical protein